MEWDYDADTVVALCSINGDAYRYVMLFDTTTATTVWSANSVGDAWALSNSSSWITITKRSITMNSVSPISQASFLPIVGKPIYYFGN